MFLLFFLFCYWIFGIDFGFDMMKGVLVEVGVFFVVGEG